MTLREDKEGKISIVGLWVRKKEFVDRDDTFAVDFILQTITQVLVGSNKASGKMGRRPVLTTA